MRAGLSELFLSIDDFWGRATELAEVLAVLDSRLTNLACQGFYSTQDDRALIVLVLDAKRSRRLDVDRLANSLHPYHIDCFELSSLSGPEKRHFQEVELPRYNVRVESAEDAAAAISELFRCATSDEAHDGWASGTPAEKRRRPLSVGSYSQIRRPTSQHEARANFIDYPELTPLDPIESLGSSAFDLDIDALDIDELNGDADLESDEPTPVMTRAPHVEPPAPPAPEPENPRMARAPTAGTPPSGARTPRITQSVLRRPPAGSAAPRGPRPEILVPPPARVGLNLTRARSAIRSAAWSGRSASRFSSASSAASR